MSIDTAELEGGRRDCPVLPCVPYTAINADRLGQEELRSCLVPRTPTSANLGSSQPRSSSSPPHN